MENPQGGGSPIEPRISRRSFAYRRAVSLFKGVLDKLSLPDIVRVIQALTHTITDWDPAPLYHYLSMNDPDASFAGVEMRPAEVAVKTFPGTDLRLLPRPIGLCRPHLTPLETKRCDHPLTLTDLSDLLFCSLSIRKQPSSERREWAFVSFLGQPVIEAYVFANYIEGVENGLYHYLPHGHMLEVLARGDMPDPLKSALSTREQSRLPAIIILTIRYEEVFKLRGHRAYRLALMEGGSALSRLIAVAASLDLEASVFFDFRDMPLCEGLGIDCYEEFPVAVVGLAKCL